MPVLGPRPFLQDLQSPGNNSLSQGEFGSCLLSLQTGNVLGEAVLRDPEVLLVTGTSCSRQHGTRRP